MNVAQHLRAAKQKIADPTHFTQGCAARNAAGDPVKPESAEAVCWCMVGAVVATADAYDYAQTLLALQKAIDPRPFGSVVSFETAARIRIAEFNDSARHSDAMAKFDEAIALESNS